ncbi:MAG TPA: MauE/DoxX family redox-associated membrane protein [Acidimicrobiia bacterium]|nr:MauE/DoxX family redox-associated membrane protein [Acidimicrobiia bacterium]
MLEAWFFIAAALLVISGGSKLIDPAPTRGALAAADLPDGAWTAPALGLAEVVAGIGGTVLGGPASVAVGVIYLGFAGFVTLALVRKLPIQSCGCFGRTDTPPTWGHLVFNLVSAAVAFALAATGSIPLDTLGDQPLAGIPYLGFVGLGVWIVYLLLAELPTLRTRRA